jgi:hypothetical protein
MECISYDGNRFVISLVRSLGCFELETARAIANSGKVADHSLKWYIATTIETVPW